jgi:sulfatase modifying factor 1
MAAGAVLTLWLLLVGCPILEIEVPSLGYTIGDASVTLRLAPAAAVFPTGVDDTGTGSVDAAYWMAETEVTYQLWKTVYDWATEPARGANQYHFQDAGQTYLTDQHPVTTVNWRDAMIWCNALTEYRNAHNTEQLACVYMYGGLIVRDSRNANATACDNVAVVGTARGFRLPTLMEWELAARYQNGSTWTPGNFASGAAAAYTDSAATQAVAWYADDSGGVPNPVARKKPNALHLYDMSGNVAEWCFDLIPGPFRPTPGGVYNGPADWLQAGFDNFAATPDYAAATSGFRLARTE